MKKRILWTMAVGLGIVALLCWLGRGVPQYEYGRFSYWLDHEKDAAAKAQAIATAVQAGAAVISLLSALVLLVVTAVYTIVTSRIARTSAGQLEASLFPMLE